MMAENKGGFPKRCSVPGGCGELLKKTAFYNHKSTLICENRQASMRVVANDDGNNAALQAPG